MATRGTDGKHQPWAFMKRFDLLNYDDDGFYLRRLRIIQTPFFGLYLHRFEGPDPRPTLHDHPYPFLSIILRGGYVERRLNTHSHDVDEQHVVRRFNRMRPTDAHAIISLLRNPTWSILLVGRRVREWGYWEPDWSVRGRWTWTVFDQHYHAYENNRAWKRRKEQQDQHNG